MRLKSVKLSGFKSFVDPTTINFPSNLGAVVGPNGCGKSNVIDAVRWVMGESSAKNLRGESMADVIFNGSSARKPVGQASVELIFDNQDRRLVGDHVNFSEVGIKRKVDRDGQSTYSLNGTSCRRKDITDVFLGTGLGARSYSIIEQGMVSRLIESKPEELRVYIEEAAGISKYKERRKETERRIKRTKENLERLTDIREELERQLQHLKRQSVAAEKYGELKKQEREASANLSALRWLGLDEEIKNNQEKIDSLQISIESSTADQRRVDADSEKHLTDNAELTDALGEVQARFYSLGSDIARVEQSIEHRIERVEQLKLDLNETEEGWNQAKEELDIDLRKITTLDSELAVVSPELESARALEVESSQVLREAEVALQKWQQEWVAFNERAEAPRQTAEVEQSKIQQLENSVGRALQRKQNLEEELKLLKEMPASSGLETVLEEAGELENSIVALQEDSTGFAGIIEDSRAKLTNCDNELDSVRSELQASEGKKASLEALQQAALGQDDLQINSWLEKHKLDSQTSLGESLDIYPGWERAVEAVLGDKLQAICVQGLGKVEELLEELPKGKLSFIDTEERDEEVADLVEGRTPLIDKVKNGANIRDQLRGIFAANNLDSALSLRKKLSPQESIITVDGIWLGRNWIEVKTKSAQDSISERRIKIDELNNKINQLNSKSNSLSISRETFTSELTDNELRREGQQSELAEKAQRLGDLKSKISAQQAKEEEAVSRKRRISEELDELAILLKTEEENIAESRANLEKALDVMADDAGVREDLEKAREETQNSVAAARDKARKNKDLTHELALKQQAIQAQLQSTRETMDRMAAQVERSKEKMGTLSEQIDESDVPIESMRAELAAFLEQRLVVEKELGVAKGRVDENESAIRELEKKRSSIQEHLAGIREQLMEVRLKSEGASVKREALLEQLQESNFVLNEVLENLPEDMEESHCEQELEKISNRIQRLGPINLAAIDEYNVQSERKVYLDSQNDDLEKALATLQGAIRKIDKETRARFKETFDKINTGLQALFPRIFGGGHAYLDMTGEDLLDTGVAIMARPPGKRNSTIHLLSGGEKAMTAIALVFSIFHLNPSPFCMLDEVDAPLDDTNVQRYANLVKEMSQSVQFIFITHNKITMEMANQLLGVTMHEAGVSRIVAVDVDEAAELAAM